MSHFRLAQKRGKRGRKKEKKKKGKVRETIILFLSPDLSPPIERYSPVRWKEKREEEKGEKGKEEKRRDLFFFFFCLSIIGI